MDRNSPKPDANTFSQLSALAIALQWLDSEGSASRPGHLLRTLVVSTQDALTRGEAPPEKDSGTLAEIWRQETAPHRSEAAPLRSSIVEAWWLARRQQLLQRLQDGGASLVPVLEVLPGGGRGIPTRYRIGFEALAKDLAEEPVGDLDEGDPGETLIYRIDPARPALWLRLLLGSKPFPVASWRGYILMGSAILNFILIALLWWAVYMHWSTPRPVTTDAITGLAIIIVLSGFLWWGTRPIRKLPTERVTLATSPYLAFGEIFGQLRTMPDSRKGDRRRIFSVVRHWGTCTVCAAEVDLDEGNRDFPGRLVGRCHDAPSEHVFSFDPVMLTGRPLRLPRSPGWPENRC